MISRLETCAMRYGACPSSFLNLASRLWMHVPAHDNLTGRTWGSSLLREHYHSSSCKVPISFCWLLLSGCTHRRHVWAIFWAQVLDHIGCACSRCGRQRVSHEGHP
eukprot:335207-Chlamydomonas_euryale.AAC.2